MQHVIDGATIEIDNAERTPCEVWCRVMGYHRPTAAFNKGKQQEHAERKWFRENLAMRTVDKMESFAVVDTPVAVQAPRYQYYTPL